MSQHDALARGLEPERLEVDQQEEDAYRALSVDLADHRWAYGTGFTAALDGVDTAVPAGVDAAVLAAYCLALGDDALIYSQRLQQWMTRAPELEEETALGNIALDLLGQARMLLSRAGLADGTGRGEDALAYFRDAPAFVNVRFVEGADADFAELQLRLLLFSTWRLAVVSRLTSTPDPVLRAIAAKAVLELSYHRDYAARWVVRLGDGTAESRRRMQQALAVWWPQIDELFAAVEPDRPAGIELTAEAVRAEFEQVLDTVLAAATLTRPEPVSTPPAGAPAPAAPTGRDGVHTAAFAGLLAELQSVARAHPGATW